MITANECRPGNWVREAKFKKLIFQAKCIDVHGDGKAYINRYNCEDLEGILLAEEWLIKAGFTFFDRYSSFVFGAHFRLKFRIIQDEVQLFIDDELWYTIKYVHQLQNLYFALTGQELTFDK